MSNEPAIMPKPEKRLKNTSFELFDSSLGCVLFVVYQFIFQLIYNVLPTAIKGNLFGAIMLSFLVEAVFGFAVLTASKIRNVDFVKATDLDKKIDWKSGLIAVALCAVCLFAFTGLTNTFMAFMEKLGYTQVVGSISVPNFGVYLIYVFLMCICPAFFEEFLFRGLILKGMQSIGKHKAVIFSALIFMLMHGGPDQTIHQFILGIVLGYAFIYSGSLWTPMIIHFLNNFVALTMLFISSMAGGAEAVTEAVTYSWLEIGISLVSSLFMAALGGVAVWLCIKLLKDIKAKKEKKQSELNLLDKERLTEEEISKLKEACVSEGKEELTVQGKTKKDNTYTIILFVISGIYLVFSWITTLITGFML